MMTTRRTLWKRSELLKFQLVIILCIREKINFQ